ncbi:MAG TPA: hypothetical protein TECP_00531 [Hyphomicrobiaceae bacterium MAG_BT-2024]
MSYLSLKPCHAQGNNDYKPYQMDRAFSYSIVEFVFYSATLSTLDVGFHDRRGFRAAVVSSKRRRGV